MAAILDEDHSIDLDAMYKDLIKVLPAYARPLFIRLLQKVDTTGRVPGRGQAPAFPPLCLSRM